MSHQILRELPEAGVGLFFAWIGFDAVDAGQNADHIAVEDGCGLIEGDAANRAGGVSADAGQGEDGGEGFWELAAMFCEDLLCRLLHVADAGVVAESFPEFVNLVGARESEAFDVGQLAHPAFPVGDHRFHLSLLQHYFRHPDGVGIARAPPREVAGVRGEPVEQQRNEF